MGNGSHQRCLSLTLWLLDDVLQAFSELCSEDDEGSGSSTSSTDYGSSTSSIEYGSSTSSAGLGTSSLTQYSEPTTPYWEDYGTSTKPPTSASSATSWPSAAVDSPPSPPSSNPGHGTADNTTFASSDPPAATSHLEAASGRLSHSLPRTILLLLAVLVL